MQLNASFFVLQKCHKYLIDIKVVSLYYVSNTERRLSVKIKDNATPIYRQIINYFEYEIASGVLERASKLSSIRELALEFKVNPNTVVRALADLEARELIYTDRTNGKFVSNDQALISGLKDQISKTSTKEYITSVKNLNMQVEEVINLLKVEWEDSDE